MLVLMQELYTGHWTFHKNNATLNLQILKVCIYTEEKTKILFTDLKYLNQTTFTYIFKRWHSNIKEVSTESQCPLDTEKTPSSYI